MQRSGRNGRNRPNRPRGDNEQQPLSNESTVAIKNKKRRKKSNYTSNPANYDPHYVPGKNPQYDYNENVEPETEHEDSDERQPTHSGHGVFSPNEAGPSQNRNRNNRRTRNQRRNRNNRSGSQHYQRGGKENDAEDQHQRHNHGSQNSERRSGGNNKRSHRGRANNRREGQDERSEKSENRSVGNNQRRNSNGKKHKDNRRKGKGLKLAKKKNEQDAGRSKVYTSDMFVYSENLQPTVPTERKMRSRKNKPSSEQSSEE